MQIIKMYINSEDFERWMGRLFEKLDGVSRDLKSLIDTKNIFDENDKLLDNQDLAFLLKVSKRTLQRYRTEKKLPYFLIGHKTLYRARDVREFVRKHELFYNSRALAPQIDSEDPHQP